MPISYTPLGDKYKESSDLTRGFPPYLQDDVKVWAREVMEKNQLTVDRSRYLTGPPSTYLGSEFHRLVQREFRREFSSPWLDFMEEIVSDVELTAAFLSLLLRNYAEGLQAEKLQTTLDHVNSEFAVKRIHEGEWYDVGCFDLEYRVKEAVAIASSEALGQKLLLDAWHKCYRASPAPDYERTVSLCADFLEGYLRDKYYPGLKRTATVPQFIKDLNKKGSVIEFAGDTFIKNRNSLVELLDGLSNIRGQHTTGKGSKPKAEEAKFVLHTTIYIWILMEEKHRKKKQPSKVSEA